MPPLDQGTYAPIALWVAVSCPFCNGTRFTRRVGACIEGVFDEKTEEILGLVGVLRFESCGHRLPGGFVDPIPLAHLMDDMESEGRNWEPAEEFDPDGVEVED